MFTVYSFVVAQKGMKLLQREHVLMVVISCQLQEKIIASLWLVLTVFKISRRLYVFIISLQEMALLAQLPVWTIGQKSIYE